MVKGKRNYSYTRPPEESGPQVLDEPPGATPPDLDLDVIVAQVMDVISPKLRALELQVQVMGENTYNRVIQEAKAGTRKVAETIRGEIGELIAEQLSRKLAIQTPKGIQIVPEGSYRSTRHLMDLESKFTIHPGEIKQLPEKLTKGLKNWIDKGFLVLVR